MLCLQEDVADRVLTMLRGALAELAVGNPDRLSTDIGPVITAEARDGIEAHIEAMRRPATPSTRPHCLPSCDHGTLRRRPPSSSWTQPVGAEAGGVRPVLHVLRYRRDGLDGLLAAINATGYGLTFGVHTRIDETIARVTGAGPGGQHLRQPQT